jgi:hypothetical protein
MRRRAFCVRVLLPIVLGTPAPELYAADSMRCGSRLVSVEDRAAEILAACGEPDDREVHSYPGVADAREIAEVERWTYNFGPNQLLHVLKLRHGRLVDIETDGYGFRPGQADRCDPSALVEGLSRFRLVRSCGPPLTRRNLGYVQTYRPLPRDPYAGPRSRGTRGGYAVEVHREEWVYNFGSRYLLKIVTIEDGVVTEVDNGDRGFDPRP